MAELGRCSMANNAARGMMGSVAGDIAVGTMMALVVVKLLNSGAEAEKWLSPVTGYKAQQCRAST